MAIAKLNFCWMRLFLLGGLTLFHSPLAVGEGPYGTDGGDIKRVSAIADELKAMVRGSDLGRRSCRKELRLPSVRGLPFGDSIPSPRSPLPLVESFDQSVTQYRRRQISLGQIVEIYSAILARY